MSIVVRGVVPSEEFALNHVLGTVPDARVEVERIIESGDGAIMPLIWIRGCDRATVEEAIEEDPSVDEVSLLADFDDEYLFRMEWIQHVRLLVHMLTTSGATILDAYGEADRWQLRVLFPERDSLSDTHAFCEDHGLSLDIQSVREMDTEPSGRFGLTQEQYTALVTGVERGYYAVPREITLEELAEDLEVSHQALSERLRRGTETLVEDTLMIGKRPEE